MKSHSKKRRKREAKARPVRDDLIDRVGKCEACHYDPSEPHPMGWQFGNLCVHEILNAGFRQKTLDAACTCLVACWWCNQYELHNRTKWPRTRQLAALKRSRPDGEFGYNLPRFLELWDRGPEAITQEEVDAWL